MRTPVLLLALAVAGLVPGCLALERDNPVDPAAGATAAEGGAGLSLVVPLPKALATVVDSLVARLEGPGMVTVVKKLEFASPLGPATLTIGAVAPGSDRTLTIEGFDLTGRLILAGERGNITVVTGDTTRVRIDLRLVIDPDELDAPDTTAAGGGTTPTVPDSTTAGGGTAADSTAVPADDTAG